MDPIEQQRLLAEQAAAGGAVPAMAPSPASLLPMMSPFGMALPAKSTTVTGPSTSVQSTRVSPEHAAGIEEQRAARPALVEAQERLGEAAVQQANQAAIDAQKQAEEQERFAAQRAAEVERHNAAIAQRQAESEKRRAAMEAASERRATSMWADRGALSEIFSHFIVGLSERSHQLAGGQAGQSPMAKELERQLAQDAAFKLAKFEDSKEFFKMSKDDIAEAERMKANRMVEIRDEHQVMIDGLIKKANTYAAAIGTASAQAKADQEVAGLKIIQAKEQAEQDKIFDQQVTAQSARTTTTENVAAGGGAAADVPKPEQAILSRDGKSTIALGMTPSMADRSRKVLTSAEAVQTEIEAVLGAQRTVSKGTGRFGARPDSPELNEAYERLARAAIANSAIDATDDKGAKISIRPFGVGISADIGAESKLEDVMRRFKGNPSAVLQLQKDLRTGVERHLTKTDAVPSEDAKRIINDYMPLTATGQTKAAKDAAYDELIRVTSKPARSGEIDDAAEAARNAGVDEARIQRLLESRR